MFFLEAQELLIDIYERLDDLGADKVNKKTNDFLRFDFFSL